MNNKMNRIKRSETLRKSWSVYKFNNQTYYDCLTLSIIIYDDGASDYWKNAADFIKQLEHVDYKEMSVKQRNWAHGLMVELRNRGY